MKNIYWIIAIVVLVAVIGGIYFYTASPNNEWQITYAGSINGASNMIALPTECYNTRTYNINETYLETSAKYIVDVEINKIEIDEQNNKRIFYFNVLGWQYGQLDFVPKSIKFSTDYDSGIEDDTPFQKFEESKAYRVYLTGTNGKISFVCEMEGIKELPTM